VSLKKADKERSPDLYSLELREEHGLLSRGLVVVGLALFAFFYCLLL